MGRKVHTGENGKVGDSLLKMPSICPLLDRNVNTTLKLIDHSLSLAGAETSPLSFLLDFCLRAEFTTNRWDFCE